MNNLVIIPARGGSKRIPYKNIKDFNGKPILAYVIQAVKVTDLFEEIIVILVEHSVLSKVNILIRRF